MLSRWIDLKQDAIQMRIEGKSITNVEKSFGIPKSTLSGWFKNIQLTKRQKTQLTKNSLKSLKKARIKAVKWHNLQKENRLKEAEKQAANLLSTIDIKSSSTQQLALAMLYLGEGIKANRELGLGNTNPLVLKFFIRVLQTNFNVDKNKIRCELYLRADQNSEKLKQYWSKQLDIPLDNFKYAHIDKRTIGSSTYPSYKGVCLVRCGNLSIQRKLLYIARKYCETITMKDD